MTKISQKELEQIQHYWQAANYLSVGQIYLMDNPLLTEPLSIKHIKPRLIGHWGTTPGLNFIYVHLNRIIKQYDLDILYITGPGHGGPALVANTYLEGTYSEIYPEVSQSTSGMKKLFKQFSFPGGIPSHTAPETPGSIHEGGELGYSLAHAFGAVLDNPNLIAACVVGDGEAETGPLAASWHANKFINPLTDGMVLPILHLNGYKIANPTILGRMDKTTPTQLFEGYGYKPYFVEGSDPQLMHRKMAETLDGVIAELQNIKQKAIKTQGKYLPQWPMIILRSPKGWTCPKEVDGKKTEDFWRSHQVPFSDMSKPEHVTLLEQWLKSYEPEKLFDDNGMLVPELSELAPTGKKRMGAIPYANGGVLLQKLNLPDFKKYAVEVNKHAELVAESTRILGQYLRDVIKQNPDNFRLMGPDEIASNRLDAVFEVTDRVWMEEKLSYDEHLSVNGRAMEILSEHVCQGWLEGYLLTGRHGLFTCYEAFIHIIDSMFTQYAKWLQTSAKLAWRKPVASLNYLLTSHVWRQDHNGFSHQDPGFIDHVVNKAADVVRVYFPPDANTLLAVTQHCLQTYNHVNVIVAGKQPQYQYLNIDEAVEHCNAGLGIWDWASNENNSEPDVVMACCGDTPTMETLAAVTILRQYLPELKIRVINIVNLMRMQPEEEHPHGLSSDEFDSYFTTNKPIIFAYHGYPWLIHRLAYRRTNHDNLHVRGYIEQGTTTTPFDMLVMNELDRYHLAQDVIKRTKSLGLNTTELSQYLDIQLTKHKEYIKEHGQDMPEIRDWAWGSALALSN